MKIPVSAAVILDPTRLGGDLHSSLMATRENRPWLTLHWCGADIGLRVEGVGTPGKYIPAARVCEWTPVDDAEVWPSEEVKRGPGRPRKE